jgi:DNA repair protein RadC
MASSRTRPLAPSAGIKVKPRIAASAESLKRASEDSTMRASSTCPSIPTTKLTITRALICRKRVGEYLPTGLGHLDYEIFGLILVDQRHRVIECIDLFRGTLDGASVHPREVEKIALLKGAAACLAYHNHPSGVQDQSHAEEIRWLWWTYDYSITA